MRDRGGLPTDRESPVGKPVIRANPEVAGSQAARFDPDDAASLASAADVVGRFSENSAGDPDNVFMLRGAAACAALVRGEGSYIAAAERAGSDATVAFIRKWARVHDLPRPIRRYVAQGRIAPTAAKHIARVSGEARFMLAWAVVDNELTVREVRKTASAINDGAAVADALAEVGAELGEMTIRLPAASYLGLRREAAARGIDPSELLSDAITEYL